MKSLAIVKPGSGSLMVRDRLDQSEEQEELATAAAIGAIPWLISTASHLVVMLALALAVSAQLPDSQILQVELGYTEELDDPLEFHSPPAVNDPDVVEEPVLEPNVRPFLEDLFMAPVDIDLVIGGEMGAGETDLPNGRKEAAKPGDQTTARGDVRDGDDTFIAKFDAYWNSASRGFQTMQSCSVDPIDENVFVAEAKLGDSHTVLAVDHYGKGRIAYYCDMTTLASLVVGLPDLVQYLGQRPEPKVLVFGYQHLCQPVRAELFVKGSHVELYGFPKIDRDRLTGTVRVDAGAKQIQITPAAEAGGQPEKKIVYTYEIKGDKLTLIDRDKFSISLYRHRVAQRPLANAQVEIVAATGINDAGDLLVTEFTVLRAGRVGATYLRPVNRSLKTKQAIVLVVQETGWKKTTVDEARRLIHEPTPVVVAYRHDDRPSLYQSHRLWKDIGPSAPDSEAVSRALSRILRPRTLIFILSARENVPQP